MDYPVEQLEGGDNAVRKSYEIMDERDLDVASTLIKMANCEVRMETGESSEADYKLDVMPSIDMSKRFKDVRALTSFNTIDSSSKQVRDHFRLEEVERYSNPYKAFSYTAYDGTKSSVAPLIRRFGKASPRARGHHMLKPRRPNYFTVLSLVRDAASRLPGRIGTRGDICVLVRDSKFILEDASESQVTSVVSGALDRLKSEDDPCIRFDREKHLWVYLHGDRKDEDF